MIPRSLAFDILFGSNSYHDKHLAIDEIYEGFEKILKKRDSKITILKDTLRELSKKALEEQEAKEHDKN